MQAEVIMERPFKKSFANVTAFPKEISVHANIKEKKISEHFTSDLHNDDSVMLAEIYGGEFQKVWKRTHKKWWL